MSLGEEPSATTGTANVTAGVEPTVAPDGSSAATGTGGGSTPGATGSCAIAYRRGTTVYVADPDGSNERRVATSAQGVFSVAPDGRTVALVDAGTGTLALFDLATGKRTAVGAANQEPPVWPLASGWAVYSTGSGTSARVRRVDRDGTHGKELFSGDQAAVSPDGSIICGIAHSASGASSVIVHRAAKVVALPVTGYATDVACNASRAFYSLAGDDGAESSIRSMSLSGSDDRPLRDGPLAGSRVSFQDLCVTADGNTIAFTETGDDGYSRLFVMGSDGAGVRSISVRRDDYPLCWGCDGRLFFIEGNTIQGETARLMAVGADGIGRVVIAEGVTR